MKIYTKNGDRGKTSLLNERVSKTDIRIEVNGQIDELMVMLAFLIDDFKNQNEEHFYQCVREIYRDLFIILSMIADKNNTLNLTIKDDDITKLEIEIDKMSEKLPKLTNFIYYTGTPTAMLCNQVRAKIRTIERAVVKLYELEEINILIISYLNRLSDYFYILARFINYQSGYKEEILIL